MLKALPIFVPAVMLPGMAAFPCPVSGGLLRRCAPLLLSPPPFLGGGGCVFFLEIAGHDKDGIAHADFRHTVRAAGGAGVVLLVICHRQYSLSVGNQFLHALHFPLGGFLPEVVAGKAYRDAHGKQAVINPGMGGVLRVVQVVQRKVGRDDQRLAAAVTAVNHIEHLFQPVFRPAFHAEVVKDQQRITTKAGNVLVAPLKAGGKVIEDKSKVRHADGDFFSP